MRKLLLFFAVLLATTGWSYAQVRPVRGTVTDKAGSPLEAVTVVVVETQRSVLTGRDGTFSIDAGNGQTIKFTYVGMSPKLVIVSSVTADLKIALEPTGNSLEDVIVTGYKTERKKDLSGSVTVVDMKEALKESNPNILTTLQSRVPGVQVQSDGTPGGNGTSIRIRGFSTVGANGPLFVIDGVATTYSGALNPNDIESIQVLKDAASASIYGSRANAGVIVITTKKGTTKAPTVTFDAYYGQNKIRNNNIQMLNAQEWGQVYWQAQRNSGIPNPTHPQYGNGASPVIPQYIDAAQTLPSANTNWIDAILRTANTQNYNLGISQALDRSNFYFGLNYSNEQGIEKYTNYQRFNARFNSNFKINKSITIGENISIANFYEIKANALYDAILQHPLIPLYDNKGNFGGPTDGLGDKLNPLGELYFNKDNKSKNWRIFGNVFADIAIWKGLTFRSSFGIDYNTATLRAFTPSFVEGRFNVVDNFLTQSNSDGLDWTATNTLNYKLQLGKHNFELFGGIEAIRSNANSFSGSGKSFLINDYSYAYLSTAQVQNGVSGGSSMHTLYSQFAKLNYNYGDRYLLAATIRRDGSSRFGKDNQYGIFPGVSAAWRISNEEFFKGFTDKISDLKLRASWGRTGNQEIGNYNTLNFYATNHEFGTYDINGSNTNAAVSYFATQLGNPQLKWESQTQTDIGIDLTVFDRITLSADYYDKESRDVLINPALLAVYGGAAPPYINAGQFQNKGFEFQAGYRDNATGDFHYSADFNITFNKNKVISLTNGVPYILGGQGNRLQPGQPVSAFYGYVADGIFKTDAEVNNGINQPGKGLGRIRYQDLNGDKVIDDNDRTWIGDPNPKFITGLNLSASYKGFDASVFVSAVYGNKIYNTIKSLTDFTYFPFNFGKATLTAWSTSNPNSSVPSVNLNNPNNELRTSTYFVENGSYLKIKSIQIGYSLPKSLISKIGINKARVYVQGQNLFTFTKYSGMDPEVGPGGVLNEGIDSQLYPHYKGVNLGLNVSF
jgi:TonB-linked SusC/RagA family outer membrane protein